jgi:gamma-glutamyltranspeptidase/glutathione hydrolase
VRGVVAAGHPLTAQAGADALRSGGNAVDAAVAAVLMSFASESPLSGPGAGGFMVVHTPEGSDHLLDFFVAAPGIGLTESRIADLVPVDVEFSAEAVQRFHVGPASVGVYGNPAGLAEALERWGTMPLADLCVGPARAARDGLEVTPMHAYLFEILGPILCLQPEGQAIYSPDGRILRAGETVRLPELGDLLERLGAEGPGFLYTGDAARAIAHYVLEHGGLLSEDDLDGYRPIERDPVRVAYRGREILTNAPPSSGGILIAHSLGLLERMGRPGDVRAIVEVMERTNRERTEEFLEGLHHEGFLEAFMASRLGSTTHVSTMDANGGAAAVTVSNGSCSGVIVPGTGVHLNNMMGEQDLNPLGWHRHERGRRIPSMMSPTVVLSGGDAQIALGSAGSNRIRSAVLQTILNVIDGGLGAQAAVEAPRVHFEAGVVEAEPGVDPDALDALEADGWKVQRWSDRNLFFGGAQAVARDPVSGELSGGGDPRRGGAAVLVD